MLSATRRLFVAVPPPAEAITLQDQLRVQNAQLKKVKWMRNHNLHLTLYFIGNIPVDKFEAAISRIQEAVQGQREFTLKFDSLVLFPARKPRMLWAKYHREEAFSRLTRLIHDALIGLLPSNEFYHEDPLPHLTLARFHSMQNYREISLPANVALPDIRIDSCELWESVKVEGRSDYRRIHRFPFIGTES